jgi:uncharacterized protein (DUF305 family)
MKIKGIFATVITVFIIVTGASAFFAGGFTGIFTKMIEQIRGLKMTGNPDSDFAHVMVEHDQGGIDLANEEIRMGKDRAVQAIAQKVLSRLQAEQSEMRKHVKKGKVSNTAQPVSNVSPMPDNVEDVLKDVEKWMKKTTLTGNTDKDFVVSMLEQFKDRVKMANIEMRHGKDQAVKDLATKIKTDSQQEEKELSEWLAGHNK